MMHNRNQSRICERTAPSGRDADTYKLELFVAEICDLNPDQLFRIDKFPYGAPDSGRQFYRHYHEALFAKGYVVSNMKNCMFYKNTEEETTFIVLLVDDTLIFSKWQQDIDQFVISMNNNYRRTLDSKGDSFLGINTSHNDD